MSSSSAPHALALARSATQSVREAANGCKVQALKDEGHGFAQKAQEILSKIEEKARSAGGQHVVQAVDHAAQLAHQALLQVQGRLTTASREYKGGFFSKVKASLDSSHKKSFREAHEKLQQALLSLDSSLDVGSTDQNAEPPAAAAAAAGGGSASSQPGQQQGAGEGDGDTQLHLRWDRYNPVHSVGLITTGLPHSKPNLWVGLRWSTEFFLGCSSAHKDSPSGSVEKGKAVTCIFCKADARCVWTGHADGTILLHADGKWGAAQYKTQVGQPIRALATDPRLNCWAGDEAGIIYMLHSDRTSAVIHLRKVDVPPGAQQIWSQTLSRSGGSGSGSNLLNSSGGAAPIQALLGKGSAMVSSGGHDRTYLTLWNSQKCEMVEHCNTQTYGAALAVTTVNWQEDAAAAAAAGGYTGSATTQDLMGWRLLTGHESGQLLLWQVQGVSARHGMRAMQLLCIILESRQISPIRHISMFEDFNMMVLADTGGWLTVTDVPTAAELARAASTMQPSVIPGAPTPSRWSPCVARIKAHKGGIVAADSLDELLVTASAATVKSWTAEQLKLEAQGDGLMFTRHSRGFLTPSSSTLSNAATAAIAANAVAAADRQQYQQQLQGNTSTGYSGLSGISGGVSDTDLSHMSQLSHDNMQSGGSGLTGGMAAQAAREAGRSSGSGAAYGQQQQQYPQQYQQPRPQQYQQEYQQQQYQQQQQQLPSPLRQNSGGSSGPAHQQQLQQQQHSGSMPASTYQQQHSGNMSAASGSQQQQQQQQQAPASISVGDGASGSVRLPTTGRFVAASASKPNPFSKAAMEARGFTVGPNNRVVPAILRDMPQQAAFALMNQVAPVMEMLTAPQWQHPGYMPGMQMPQLGGGGPMSQGQGLMAQPASAGQGGGGLVETSSIKPSDAIKADHIITCGELELNVPIGVGAEGKVYRGKWCSIDIAAKEYLAVDDGETDFSASGEPTEAARLKAQNALLKEVGILAKLTHPNLVRFCGVCLDPPLVVMEFYRNGSMFKMLECARAAVQQGRSNKYVNYLSWKRRLQMLHDVASGMLYLHSRRYVHGDLRSPNLFVTENGRVKIGDFGFTKRLKRSKETIKVGRITHPRWVAPELLGESNMSTASDVYSFGIIMYEMLTFKIPFEECAKAMVAIKVLAHAMRPQIPTYDKLPPNTSRICLDNYIRLMQDCWAQDPKQRPSFATVARRLKAMQHWFFACSNSLHISSTTVRLNNLRQNSNSSKPALVPLAVGSGLSFKLTQHDAAAVAAAHGAHMAGGARGAAAAAAAGGHHLPHHPLQQQHPQQQHLQQQYPQQQHIVEGDSHEDVPPPVPEPEVAAAAKAAAPKPSSEPSVQVSLVGGKPIVCIDVGEGKPDLQAVEEKLLAEMQSLTLKQGQAVAEQAQFIIVGPDLPPERTLSTISEATLHMQASAGSALVSGGAVVAPQADGRCPSAASHTDVSSAPPSRIEQQLSGVSAGISEPLEPVSQGPPLMPTVPQLLPAAMLPAIRESSDSQQRLGSSSGGSRQLPTAATAGAVAAGAAAVSAAAAAAAGMDQMPHPAPIRVSSSFAAAGAAAASPPCAKPLASNINAFMRDAGQAEPHDKVKDWLTADTGGSMELSGPPGDQQQQQMLTQQRQQQVLSQQQQQQQHGVALHPVAAGNAAAGVRTEQQQQQQLLVEGFAGAGGAAAAAAAAGCVEQEVSDVFGAQDSPFCMLLPPCASSGTVDLGLFKRAASSVNAAAVPVATGNSSSMLGEVSMASFMDPNALDDSTLPAADGSGGGLSEAPTIYYPEECSPAEALAMSAASIRSCSINSSTPTLFHMAGAAGAMGAMGGGMNAGAGNSRSLSSGGGSHARRGAFGSDPNSFTATERSPFACLPVGQDDDAPLPAADAAAAPGSARGAGTSSAGRLPPVDSNAISCGPFGRMPATAGEDAPLHATAAQDENEDEDGMGDMGPFGKGAPAGLKAAEDSVVREAGPFGAMQGFAAAGAAGEGSVVRDFGPFGHMMGPKLGAPGVNEDSIAPPLPPSPRSAAGGGLGGPGGDPAGGVRPSPSPPPSPGPGSSRTSAAGSGGVACPYGMQGQHVQIIQQYPPPASPKGGYPMPKGGGMPASRFGSSPRHGSPAPAAFAGLGGPAGIGMQQGGMGMQQGGQGYGGGLGMQQGGGDVRRWSTSSRASSVAGPPGGPAPLGQYHDGGALGMAGGGGGGGGGGGDAAAAAGGSAAGGGGSCSLLHRPLDDSVLNKNLRVALGRQPTAEQDAGDIDVVDAQQRDFEVWQNRAGASSSVRRVGSSSTAPAATAGWHVQQPATGGLLPAENMKGWVPGMLPPEAVLHPGGAGMHAGNDGGGNGGNSMPAHMPGWTGDGILPYGASVAARGRTASGVDSTAGMGGWGPGAGTSPPAGAGIAGGLGGYGTPGGGSTQAAAYMQMQAAAAQGAVGNWFPSVQHASQYGQQGVVMQQGGMGMGPVGPPSGGGGGFVQAQPMADAARQQLLWQQQQQQAQQQYQQQQQQQQNMYKYQQRGPM